MTRNSDYRRPRPSKKVHHYEPKRVKLHRKKPLTPPTAARVVYVQEPYYTQMQCGNKTVEARPYFPCFHDLSPGQYVKFCHRSSGSSFLARITHRRFDRHIVHMLRHHTIRRCLPDHDPDDLQRAVNTYNSFLGGIYRELFRKYGVVSFCFIRVDPDSSCTTTPEPKPFGKYDKNSLVSIFEAVKNRRRGNIPSVCRYSKRF